MATGIPGITAQVKKLGEALLWPMVAFLTAQSKIRGAFDAMGIVLSQKLLGPLGNWATAIIGINRGINAMAKAWKEAGIAAAAANEGSIKRMEIFSKSLTKARDRMDQIKKLSGKSAFSQEEWGQAADTLDKASRGALSTTDSLEMLGDAATSSGTSITAASDQVAGFYTALMAGEPIRGAADQLESAGIFSAGTAKRLDELSQSGSSASAMWKEAEKDIKRASGAMDEMAGTLNGLTMQLAKHKEQASASFAMEFLEGDKALAEATLKAHVKLDGAMQAFAKSNAVVSNAVKTAAASVLDFVTSLPGVATGLKFAAGGAGLFFTALQALMALKIVGWLTAVLLGTKAAGGAAKSAALGFSALGDAMKLAMAGQGAMALQATKTGGTLIAQGGIVGVLTTAWKGLRTVMGLVIGLFWDFAKALFMTPMGRIAVLLTLVIAGLYHFWNETKRAKQEVADLNQKLREQNDLFEKHIKTIKTVSDLAATYEEVVRALAIAEAEYAKAKADAEANPGDENKAQTANLRKGQVDSLKNQIGEIKKIGAEQLTPAPDIELGGAEITRAKRHRDAAFQRGLSGLTPEEQAAAITDKASEENKTHLEAQDRAEARQADAVKKARGEAIAPAVIRAKSSDEIVANRAKQELIGEHEKATAGLAAAKEATRKAEAFVEKYPGDKIREDFLDKKRKEQAEAAKREKITGADMEHVGIDPKDRGRALADLKSREQAILELEGKAKEESEQHFEEAADREMDIIHRARDARLEANRATLDGLTESIGKTRLLLDLEERRIAMSKTMTKEEKEAAQHAVDIQREKTSIDALREVSDKAARAGNKPLARMWRKQANLKENRMTENNLREEGYGDEQIAAQLREQKIRQKIAGLEEEGGGGYKKGRITASSMQRIGGGGNWAGTGDVVPQKLDRMINLLQQLRDATRGEEEPFID